ncbi:MAG: hypothetical protein K5660_07640 [Paludibacteraceae bacterium]|nr:hypothetical protein [Paludibacteraceae bacterium]
MAYVRDGGKHGLAICDLGWGELDLEEDVEKRGIPSIEELKLIYENRDIVRLFEKYWSCNMYQSSWVKGKLNPEKTILYVMDFATGGGTYHRAVGEGKLVVLKIYRF